MQTELLRRAIDLTPEQDLLEKILGENLYTTINLLVFWDKIPDGNFLYQNDLTVNNWLMFLKKFNYHPISEFYVASVLLFLSKKLSLELPHKNALKVSTGKLRKDRQKFIIELLQNFDITWSGDFCIKFVNNPVPITHEFETFIEDTNISSEVQNFLEKEFIGKAVTRIFRDVVSRNKGLVVLVRNTNPDFKSPTLSILTSKSHTQEGKNKWIKMSDHVVYDETEIFNITLHTLIQHHNLMSLKSSLEKATLDNKISVDSNFTSNKLKFEYGLMRHIKQQVKQLVTNHLETHKTFCDRLDLEYQTLFRLTTFKVEEIFVNGDILGEEIKRGYKEIGWRSLLNLDNNLFIHLKLNCPFIEKLIFEQAQIITKRLETSELPLKVILGKQRMFSEDGWVIQKDDTEIYAVHPNRKKVTIEFKEVDTNLAYKFHNDLHYIHTPRCWKAFGFFIKGDEVPFSVISIEKVDRTYKKNALLLFGYDPRHCVEFTRLYSWPGVPKNTTSAIFGQVFSYLKTYEPRIEAAISAFMPTYASGLSMLTGGFKHPILLKQDSHSFTLKNINGLEAMEHVTNRRQTNCVISCKSKFPLLPTIELIAQIKEPRFLPFLTIGRDVIEV